MLTESCQLAVCRMGAEVAEKAQLDRVAGCQLAHVRHHADVVMPAGGVQNEC